MSTPGIPVIFCNACGAHNHPDARFCQSCGQAMAAIAPVPVTASIAAYASHPYGGFWIRLLAWFIDVCIINMVLVPISMVLGVGIGVAGSITHMPEQGVPIAGAVIGFGLGVFGSWLYEALMTSSSKQATLGKLVVGLAITDSEGKRLTLGRATGRHFAKYLSAAILGIGYLMIAFSEKKQGLHDLIVATLVQKTR